MVYNNDMTQEAREEADKIIEELDKKVVKIDHGAGENKSLSADELWKLAQKFKDNPIPDDNSQPESAKENR